MINMTGMLVGAAAIAAAAAFAGSQYQKGIDLAACAAEVARVRQGAVDALNIQGQELLTTIAERDQAKAEVDRVNATTILQYAELQTMLADDQVKREEASTRVEAAAKEAARNARTAVERATAARDLTARIQDQCAGAPIPADVERLLDGILRPGSAGAAVVNGSTPAAAGQGRP